MIKMSDVAKQAKVSTATVSRVLRNPETVREETKQKVLQVIKELNYQPNVLARQLRTNKTNTILVVVPSITNTVFAEILGGIEKVASERDYRVLLGNSNHQLDQNEAFLDHLKQKQVDGVILLTADLGETILTEISHQYPIVLASEFIEGSTIPTVAIDNVLSGKKATDHLIQLGHRKIAHFSGPMEGLLSRGRLKGYQEALTDNNIEYNPDYVKEGDFTFESGYHLMKNLLEEDNPPTALFAANDEMAIGAMKAAMELGRRIPEDLAVVGFDNIKFSSIFEPTLTTIAQPLYEMGIQSMELLIQQIHQEPLNKKQYVLDSTLVVRTSCGAMSTGLNQ